MVDPLFFKEGDQVILMVMKGAEIYSPLSKLKISSFWGKISNMHNTGYYSVHTVSGVSGNRIIFSTPFPALKKGIKGEVKVHPLSPNPERFDR